MAKKTPPPFIVSFRRLLILAFFEGSTVMAIELLGAKMMIPYYGSSLIIWTSVIGITLTSLTIGYFIGGQLSVKKSAPNVLFYSLVLGALIFAFMPMAALPIIKATAPYGIYLGSILCAFILFGLPLICMGITSPIIIRLLTEKVEESGQNAGFVFSVSTIGGILTTFILGYFIIPYFGISRPAIIAATLLIILTFGLLFRNSKIIPGTVIIILLMFIGLPRFLKKNVTSSKDLEVVYSSEGLLGQVSVYDRWYENQMNPDRQLLINGIPQTNILKGDPRSYWYYVHMIATISSLNPPGSNALLMGFGGGSMATELTDLGFNIDAVDIDKRMFHVAEKYFSFNPKSTTFFIDDTRHYIKTMDKTYDLVIFDLLAGETQPTHCFSKESFMELKPNLKPGGMILINFQSFFKGENGRAVRSIYKTLKAAGFGYLYYTYLCEEDAICDIVMIASEKVVEFSKIREDRLNYCCTEEMFVKDLLSSPQTEVHTNISKGEALVYTDDRPILEHHNAEPIIMWRLNMMEDIAEEKIEAGIDLFQ